MSIRLPSIAVALTLSALPYATATPASAATGDIDCIEAKLGPAAMQRIGNGVVAAADAGRDPSTALDADREAVLAAREACRTANSWSPQAVQTAMSYMQGRATGMGVEPALRRDGLDSARIKELYAALPADDRRSLIARASPAAIGTVTKTGPGMPARRHVLLYFASLAAVEFYPKEFASS